MLALSLLHIILLVVAIVVLLYWLHAFFILYHFIRFGVGTRPKKAAFVFFIGSLGLFFFLTAATVAFMLEIPPFIKATLSQSLPS